jgi:hypothetical protein
MSAAKFKEGDYVLLNGYAGIQHKKTGMFKPIPKGTMGYVLTTRQNGRKMPTNMIRVSGPYLGTPLFEAIVRFDGWWPAIAVEESLLVFASTLDRLVREI